MLARALPYVPAGVHLAVVDPEVGARRRAVALRTAEEDRLLVGPDNGLLLAGRRAVRRRGGGGRDLGLAVAAGAGVGDVPRPRPVRPRRRAAGGGRPLGRGGRAARARRARHAATLAAAPGGGRAGRPRGRDRRRSATRSSTRRTATSLEAGCGSATRSRRASAARRVRGVVARTFADVGRAGCCSTRTRAARSRWRSTAATPPRCSACGRATRCGWSRREPLGRPRLHLRAIGSTNERARELAAAGAPHGTLVTAGEQTAGAGARAARGSRRPAPRSLARWSARVDAAAAAARRPRGGRRRRAGGAR